MTLFTPAPDIFTIPPSAPFLDALARGIVDASGVRDDPQALADWLIFLPNHRAKAALALALHQAIGRPFLAPDIRALGDVAEDDASEVFDALDLPPAYSPAKRRGALARLIQAWRRAQQEDDLPPHSALAAADELGRLLDQAAMAGEVDWAKLAETAPEQHLAAHWELSANFLRIVAEAWPKHLKEHGAVDAMARRCLAGQAVAARWAAKPPQHPVLIAGSTGSAEATRILMRATLALPRGAIVFPGLDVDMTPQGWAAVGDSASHPQHSMGRTLRLLNLKAGDARLWPGVDESEECRARCRLINEALAPAETTKTWSKRLKDLAAPRAPADLVKSALRGVTLVEAEDESEEALAAALLMREALENGQSCALVTPEAGLSRRVAVILKRWNVEVGPSAGEPLHRTAVASFLLMLMRWARDPADPVHLLAVLKHELARLRRTPEELQRLVSRLERYVLRGPRRDRTLAQLRQRLVDLRMTDEAALVADLERTLIPWGAAFDKPIVEGRAAAEATARLAERIAAPDGDASQHIWAGRAGAMAARYLEQLAETSAEMGGVASDLWPEFADAAAQGMTVVSDAPEHPSLSIWGPLEARLQTRDRVILASLNEGAWPRGTPADAFLNRNMRKQIGLPDPDERIGLSAHDFAQMANASEVFLLRAKRVEDKPAVASRWLWRLQTLAAGGLNGRAEAEAALAPPADANPLTWARSLRRAETVTPISAPAPRPPVAARKLDSFSPTRVAALVRDPYADFARYILGLTKLRRVGEEIDARERGSAVHLAVEIYDAQGGSIEQLIIDSLTAAGASPEIIELERPLWRRAAEVYLRWLEARRDRVAAVAIEAKSEIILATGYGPVRLHAKADRIEKLTDGTLAIIDFKTGAIKTAEQVKTGLEPQLPLEAIIAAHAGFGQLGPAPTSELVYFQMTTGKAVLEDRNGQPLEFAPKKPKPGDLLPTSTAGVIAYTAARFADLVDQYADPSTPYLSKPRVLSVKAFDEFDRLARRGEWTTEEGEE